MIPTRKAKNDHIHACQKHACLTKARIFAKISSEDLAGFQKAAVMQTYKKGKILYLEDEATEHFYVICQGWIKLFHSTKDGDEIIVSMASASDVLGADAAFTSGRTLTNAEVVEDAQLLKIPATLLKDQVQHSKAFALEMISFLFREARECCYTHAVTGKQSASQRIGGFLLRLAPPEQDEGIMFKLPYDKSLIAYTLNMQSGSFSRALHILRKETGIRVKGDLVEIDSKQKLAQFVTGSGALAKAKIY